VGLRDSIPSFDSGDTTIEIVEPEARTATSSVMILVASLGIVSLVLISSGILPESARWVPLGIFLFLMVSNPIVTLPRFWEAIIILLMYALLLGYVIVYHLESAANTMLVAVTLLLIVFLFEYPRRFSL